MHLKKLKIGCHDYEIIFQEKIVHNENECLGLCSPDSLKIYLRDSLKQTPDLLLETLIHEALHAIEVSWGVKLGEKKVGVLGCAVYDLFKNNNIIGSCKKRCPSK